MKNSFLLLLALFLAFPFVVIAQPPSKWLRSTADTTNIYNINSGKVGIGTTSPAYTLDVNSGSALNTIRASSNSTDALITVENTATSGRQYSIVSSGSGSGLGAGNFSIFDNTAATARLTITPSGNVGIGTTSPTTFGTNGVLSLNGVGGSVLEMMHNGTSSALLNTDGTDFAIINRSTTGALKLFTNNTGTLNMTLLPSGRVGIGTSSPDQMLTVNGTVHATKVFVDLDMPAPDYVFEKDYKLRPLSEVRRYVNLNKHLPEIPSAKNMATNGVNVSEMNMKLLKKVEELTLYLLEKDKQMAEQKKTTQTQLDQMKRQLNALTIKNAITKKR